MSDRIDPFRPSSESFDRLTRLASQALRAPAALIMVLDQDRQFIESAVGIAEPWTSAAGKIPLARSFCRHTADPEQLLVIEDARANPLVKNDPAVTRNGWIAYAGAPLTSEGRIWGTLCVLDTSPRKWSRSEIQALRDLAASVQTEIDLQEMMARYALVQRATNDTIWDWDFASGEIVWNEGITVTFGYPHGMLRTDLHWWSARLHPEEVARVSASLDAVIKGGQDSWTEEHRFQRADGSYAIVLDRGVIHRREDGTATRAVGSMQDVTQRVEAEREKERIAAEARLNLQRLEAVLAALPVGVFITDAAGVFEITNAAALEIWGGKTPLVGIDAYGEYRAWRADTGVRLAPEDWPVARALCTGESVLEEELEIETFAGVRKRIHASGLVFRDGAGQVLGGIAVNNDITARILTEQKLQAYSVELERSNRELQDFARIASHDLQEPLRKVQAFADRLKSRYADALDDTGRDFLERMQRATGRMQALIQDLLTYGRVTSKAHPFHRVDLHQTVEQVVQDLSTRIEQAGGQVTIERLPEIDADALQMRQVFQNLIANALKFHREDVPPIVTISGVTLNGTAEIRVTDNGIGFEMEYAERMFRPFERLHGRMQYEGTGIGLAIVHKIVERHGGTIEALSAPGAGASFVLRLPLHHHQLTTTV